MALFLAATWTVPHRICMRHADAWFEGDPATIESLAAGLERWVSADLGRSNFDTGSELFDREWVFGTYMMAAMGFGQSALADPPNADRHLARMDAAIERLLDERARAFDTGSWNSDALETLDGPDGHVAYLGYLNLVLALRERVRFGGPHERLHGEISYALARRLKASPIALLETYPDQVYPVDNCSAIASVAMHAQRTGADHSAALAHCEEALRERYMHMKSGLLVQAVDPDTGVWADDPRGSGTMFAVYFLSFGLPDLARELYGYARLDLFDTLLGFGLVREYPSHVKDGRGDIDSGPIVLGYGVSATGFALGAARACGDREVFGRCLATATLFGAPHDTDDDTDDDAGGRTGFLTGGPIGDAILFAMLTAPRIPGAGE